MVIARVFIVAAMLTLIASTADAQSKSSQQPSQPPINVAPGSTITHLGNGTIIHQPGQPDTQVTPLGNGVIIRQQGKPTVECHPLGNNTVCR
jgi:hypothetical protein